MHNIVIGHSLYPPHILGGAEISTKILAECMSKHLKVNVLTVGDQRDAIVRETQNEVSIVRLPAKNIFWYGDKDKQSNFNIRRWHVQDIYANYYYKQIRNELERINPTLIHTQKIAGFSLAVWKAAHDLKIPIVHTLRDYSLLYPRYYRLPAIYFTKYVNAVIGLSQYTLDEHLASKMFTNSAKYVVPNAIKGIATPKNKVRHGEPLIVGYFGRLAEDKGVSFLIEAIKGLPDTIVKELRIYGEGPFGEQLIKEAIGDKRIIFAGKKKELEVQIAMADVDITVVPSKWNEPFGRVIIESYEVGTPVIASNIGGIPEVILDKSYLVDVGQPEAIQKALYEYYHLDENKKETLREICLEHSNSFSEENLIKRQLEIYDLVLKESNHVNR
ncbi:glycosyltransferase involved in cell wall biosynthesis [Paenibacillus phyllosphaerae]|uniref:Glycosyltransferase involved in cell wall biosynthesis n=1 Tax=Paenibacillus phyllosphaerae TaxID=274593 RepID=A0A7W5FL31_9BACL|nr:glycosyltransferase family 4 protein [Paenibacillus phyllosphaerae]MBB3108567.1 glycosyltransferase involved in cell wall biosynthesis [Paenibacillus phyllosphaerae]